MVIIGATPPGRHVEQHDVFFGVGTSLKELVPDMKDFWPEAKGKLHIDAWREVTSVDGYRIEVAETGNDNKPEKEEQLFFLNLGGYQRGTFDELHFKMLTVKPDKAQAIKQAMKTPFYKQFGFPGATSHIDDKYGVDVDDIYNVCDILLPGQKDKYRLSITKTDAPQEDELHIGYFKLTTLP